MTPNVPDRPTLDGLEAKWDAVWHEQGTYAFDRSASRAEVYAIDTPPPTVSGSLHMGVTNPVEATPGSIRGDYALEIGQNLVHGSDSPASAAREIGIFFPGL